jgi:hypothetical protein
MLNGLIYIVCHKSYPFVGDEVLRFDPASGDWITLAPTLFSRSRGSSFVLAGCLYAAGGFSSPSSVERYDVATDTWEEVADMLVERTSFGVVTIGSAGPAEEQDLSTRSLPRQPSATRELLSF